MASYSKERGQEEGEGVWEEGREELGGGGESEEGREEEGMERGEGQRVQEESMATNKNDTFVLSESVGYSL